jgi:hypothetical protein
MTLIDWNLIAVNKTRTSLPLLKGEGGAQRRVRGTNPNSLYPSPDPSGHPLPSGEGRTKTRPWPEYQ